MGGQWEARPSAKEPITGGHQVSSLDTERRLPNDALMGMLVEGTWSTEWYQPDSKGHFVRGQARFRDWISSEATAELPATAGRYHLYVSLACPWAHRTLILRSLRQLQGVIGISVVHPLMGDDGWSFDEGPGCTGDTLHASRYLREIYLRAKPDYTGRVTVPVLWDRERGAIVNNESREIVRMLDVAFRDLGDPRKSLLPSGSEPEVDAMIDEIYAPINNGVYRVGFATTQQAYEEALGELFSALGRLERRLGERRYLMGDSLTEADVCLFTTLFRFDPVYHYHFKCNRRRLRDYPNLWGYTRDIYQIPGVAETCDLSHIKQHYYRSHPMLNPTRIVPQGPEIDFSAPHGRG